MTETGPLIWGVEGQASDSDRMFSFGSKNVKLGGYKWNFARFFYRLLTDFFFKLRCTREFVG